MLDEPLNLNAEEVRVLGCLLEKEATTPDIYPLTLNSLSLACNQKSNRFPVVEYDEETVAEALDSLRTKKLVYRIDMAGARVAKYRHNVDESLGLSRSGKALLTILLLRGPQTLGELRTRTERIFNFATIQHVEDALREITEEVEIPVWEKLPRAPGQKEERFRQVFSTPPEEDPLSTRVGGPPLEAAVAAVQSRNERMDRLEAEVAALKAELAEIKDQLEAFKRQFE